MIISATLIIAILSYLSIFLLITRKDKSTATKLRTVLVVGIAFHMAGLFLQFFQNYELQLSFFKVPSLLFCIINVIILFSSLKKPTLNVLVLIAPLSTIAIACSLAFISPSQKILLSTGTSTHILLSLLAYSLLTIATMQALLLAYQNHKLRIKQLDGLIRILPPLQTMEALLFELLWVGFTVLSISIVTGIIFTEIQPEQKIAHKAFFSITSWLIYAVLLGGHYRQGWRGNTAIRFTLGGFIALMLAYFGSKLVLELIL